MVLKGLELQGFKSFPDKTKLAFEKGLTAVVGPNGSGKSNISDAIRWVLGEQSSKSLRGSKMEDVVFGGTSKRKPLGFAEVSLFINNKNRFLDFDSDDVKVTRRYYRSGESEYLLNNATVRLKDVQLLFMDTGLGRDGYSMIGQGKIGDIVSSKSTERREMFEEAAGVAKYRYRKTEAERRLSSAEENLLRLRDILTELEDRVAPLKIQAEKAKIFLGLEFEKRELEISIWLRSLEDAKEKMRRINSQIELAKTQYDSANTDIDEIEQEISDIFATGQKLEVEMEEIRAKSGELEESATKKEGEVAVFRNDIFHNNENKTRLKEEKNRLGQSDKDFDEEIAIRQSLIEEKKKDIEKASEKADNLVEELNRLTKSSDEQVDQIQKVSEKASRLALSLSDFRVNMVSGETSLSEIVLRLSSLSEVSDEQKSQKEKVEIQLDKSIQTTKTCDEKVTELKNALNGYEMRHKSRLASFEEAKEKANKCHLDAEERRRRVKNLEDLERNMEGFNRSVKVVMKQSERGRLNGIHGPVTHLIETNPETALAIETALGAGAQNIVCENEQVAKQVINYLSQNKGGRATLLPLTSIKGRSLNEQGLETQQGFIGIASELVTYDSKYRNIIDSLIGRVVVVESLDDAITIAKKHSYRFRIVTIDGQVVNAGGSMTGGSSVRGAGLLSRRADIERMKKEVKELLEKEEVAAEKWRKAGQEVSASEAALVGCRSEVSVASEDLIRFDSEVLRLTEQKENLFNSVSQNAMEIEKLNIRSKEYKTQIGNAKMQMEEIHKEQKLVDRDLEALSGGREENTFKREKLSTEISDSKLLTLEMKKEIEAGNTAVSELRLRRESSARHLEQINLEIANMDVKNKAIESEIENMLNDAEEFRKKGKELTENMQSLVKKRRDGEEKQTKLRTQTRDKSSEKEKIGAEVVRLEEQAVSMEKEGDDIIRRLYEEYELTRLEAESTAKPIKDFVESNKRLTTLRNKIRRLGSVNVDAIEEYKEVSERYEELSVQVEDVEVSRSELLKLINELTEQMQEIFLERFNEINYNYGIIFKELFGGGKADLTLTDPNDILNSGIEMNVQPPGKVILNMDSLSGGEKSLVAIALFFAILKVSPSPFCVLDEIEASLDDVNVDRYANFLKDSADETQFIVITHRRGTMEKADTLYGVTMQEQGVSKLLELRASEVEEKLGFTVPD